MSTINTGTIQNKMMFDADYIKHKLLTDDTWLMRGVMAIYRMQTNEEKYQGRTIEYNNKGFNGVDASILSSFGMQLQRGRQLSVKQLAIARKKMLKYSNQLAWIAGGGA